MIETLFSFGRLNLECLWLSLKGLGPENECLDKGGCATRFKVLRSDSQSASQSARQVPARRIRTPAGLHDRGFEV